MSTSTRTTLKFLRGSIVVLGAACACSVVHVLAEEPGRAVAAARLATSERAVRPRALGGWRPGQAPRPAHVAGGSRRLEDVLAALERARAAEETVVDAALAREAAAALAGPEALALLAGTERLVDAASLVYAAGFAEEKPTLPVAVDAAVARLLLPLGRDAGAPRRARALAALGLAGLGTPAAASAAAELLRGDPEGPLAAAVAAALAGRGGERGRAELMRTAEASDALQPASEAVAALAARALGEEAVERPELAREIVARASTLSSSRAALTLAASALLAAREDDDVARSLGALARERAARADDPTVSGWLGIVAAVKHAAKSSSWPSSTTR